MACQIRYFILSVFFLFSGFLSAAPLPDVTPAELKTCLATLRDAGASEGQVRSAAYVLYRAGVHGRLTDKDIDEKIIGLLKHKEFGAREPVAYAFIFLEMPHLVKPMLEALNKKEIRQEKYSFRLNLITGLLKKVDATNVESIVETTASFLDDENSSVRYRSVRNLEEYQKKFPKLFKKADLQKMVKPLSSDSDRFIRTVVEKILE